MDEAFAPEGTIDRVTLERLVRRSDGRGLGQFLGHLAALTATGLLVAQTQGTFWLAPALLLHGVVLAFLFAPLHETIHRTAFRGRRLNDAVAWLCGLSLLLPPDFFRAFHFAHHRTTQDPARDPELTTPKPASVTQYLWLASGLPFWRERITTLLRHAMGRIEENFIAEHLRPAIVREARIALAVYGAIALASVLLESWAAVLYWVLPALLGQPALRLFLMAEHTGCPLVPGMLENSRTTRSNPLVRALSWNMPFHAEHHAYPALTFHALPAAHGLLKDRIAVRATGYLAAHRDIIGGFKVDRSAPTRS